MAWRRVLRWGRRSCLLEGICGFASCCDCTVALCAGGRGGIGSESVCWGCLRFRSRWVLWVESVDLGVGWRALW